MHITPSSRPPQDSPRSSAYSATNFFCFPGQENPQTFQLWTTGSRWAREFGTQPMSTSSRQCGDTRTLQMSVGCMPRLSTRDLCLRLPCRKLSPCFIDSFTIKRQINDVTSLLQLPARYRIHPTFHVSLLKPFSPSVPDTEGPVVPPPPEVQEEPSIYQVREILDSRRQAGHLEYPIDWEGYGPEERSWVARNHVLDPSLLTDFCHNHPDRPAPRGSGRPRRSRGASGAAPGGGGTVRESRSSVTTNYTHQIQLTWLLITATCYQSSRALYQRTPPEQSLSGLKHSMLTDLTLLPFCLQSRRSCVPLPDLHRLQTPLLPLVPLDKVKDWLLPNKTL